MPLALLSALSLAFALTSVSAPLRASVLHVSPVPAALIEGPAPDGTARARVLFEAGRYAEAAAAFEAEWDAHRAPRSLFNAAVARERLGHEAAAYVHLCRFLATPELTPAERSAGQQRLTKLIARTVPLQVTLTPVAADTRVTLHLVDRDDRSALEADLATFASEADPGVIEVQVEAGTWRVRGEAPGFRAAEREVKIVYPDPGQVILALEPEAVRVVIAIEPEAAIEAGARVQVTRAGGGAEVVDALGSTSIDLAPGQYVVEVTAPGFEAQRTDVEVEVGMEARPVAVMLWPKTPSRRLDPSERYRRPIKGVPLGLGLAGSAVVVAGATLWGIGENRHQRLRDTLHSTAMELWEAGGAPIEVRERNKASADAASNRLRWNLAIENWGGALVGGGVGMSVSALSSLSPRAGKQIAGWEVGIGAALAVGGVVNYGLNEAIRFSLDKYGEDPRRDLSLLRPWTSVVASMAGFGVGLALGGVIKLIYHRRRHRGESIVVRPGIGGGLLAVEGGF